MRTAEFECIKAEQIELTDSLGRTRIVLEAEGSLGLAHITMLDSRGNAVASVLEEKYGASFTGTVFTVRDAQGRPRASLWVDNDSGDHSSGQAVLSFLDENGGLTGELNELQPHKMEIGI